MEEQTIYIGPSVQSLGLMRNQVYLGGIPGEVRAALAKYPEFEELIVPVEDLMFMLYKVATPGEHLHHVYKELCRKWGVH